MRIEDVAGEAGVATGLLYRYFGGRRDLLIGCFEYATARVSEHLDAAAPLLAVRWG